MKAILADYDEASGSISIGSGAEPEEWPEVCERFNNDVHRICGVMDQGEYTALYECFDEKDRPAYYLVREDASLYKMRRKHFLDNIGQDVNEK